MWKVTLFYNNIYIIFKNSLFLWKSWEIFLKNIKGKSFFFFQIILLMIYNHNLLDYKIDLSYIVTTIINIQKNT